MRNVLVDEQRASRDWASYPSPSVSLRGPQIPRGRPRGRHVRVAERVASLRQCVRDRTAT